MNLRIRIQLGVYGAGVRPFSGKIKGQTTIYGCIAYIKTYIPIYIQRLLSYKWDSVQPNSEQEIINWLLSLPTASYCGLGYFQVAISVNKNIYCEKVGSNALRIKYPGALKSSHSTLLFLWSSARGTLVVHLPSVKDRHTYIHTYHHIYQTWRLMEFIWGGAESLHSKPL